MKVAGLVCTLSDGVKNSSKRYKIIVFSFDIREKRSLCLEVASLVFSRITFLTAAQLD